MISIKRRAKADVHILAGRQQSCWSRAASVESALVGPLLRAATYCGLFVLCWKAPH